MKLSFHGAAHQVTGSCHLLECGGRKILIDCGMFQGSSELHESNAADFGFEPREIDAVLLTHAHLDHCGRLPLLVKRGFRGEIIATSATKDLARLVMMDSAHLHEEEARRHHRHGLHGGPHEALYDTMDALDAVDRFGRVAKLKQAIHLFPGITATFYDAGHILGSSSILVSLTENGRTRKILFSGDIGPNNRPLLNDPDPPSDADIVVMETTYGDRNHRPLDASITEFLEAIQQADARGGNVIIPTFAMERAQELLWFLRQGMQSGEIRKSLKVFLDSPMAISATRIFARHQEAMRPELAALMDKGIDPFKLPDLHFTQETQESMGLNRIRSGAVIMAGSGMCTGGRVRHHLRHNLPHSDCSVIFVGYAAEGTLARIIIDGAREVKLFGDLVPVKAKIHTINGFSAHADADDLKHWLARTGHPERIFLVHGEEKAMQKFAQGLNPKTVETPRYHATYEL
ncbi:MBL fold metallo-hydrolase RNA specificity domain-containing protein [Celeribacter sp. PS-C1]|uniref:MBL fold metallo-hydrolase RNA specificity domain-containing protein n=1 Tax=Celeribacter sp. PS-C1 TaxID=2820813 RepID=UPI001C679F26|nr:MBL fold metallo-hydrolase [Celeribacter sp. PS-C1]MBW6417662.1 MBL fold metallo-hydrolase [Celeribacter sp. PS-C1]